MKYKDFLQKLYFKSLTPFEILEVSKTAELNCKKKENFDYLNYWKQTVSKDKSESTFDMYCLINGLTNQNLLLMISDVYSLNKELEFPDWVKVLDSIMTLVDSTDFNSKMNDNKQQPFYSFFAPFIDYIIKKIKETELVLSIDLISQLKNIIYNDLYELAHLVLIEEFEINKKIRGGGECFSYENFILDNIKDNYQSFFVKYPVLAKKIMVKICSLLSFVEKILKNLNSDKEEIGITFSRRLGNVDKLHLSAGDLHNGESTVIIEFDDLYKIVYKPTSTGITKFYNSFIDWVNNKLNDRLKTFNVIDKGTYGWMEFIEHTPCDTIDDIRIYYERAGMLLGIAHVLNSKDFHYENVIASGNSPVLIDHETLLSPSLNRIPENVDNGVFNIIGTVLETSLLPIPRIGLPFFMYGFGSSQLMEANNTLLATESSSVFTVVRENTSAKPELCKLNKPLCNGRIENIIDYEVEFKRGFKKVYNLVLNNKEYLLSTKSPILGFSNCKIRFINRQTKVYYKILKYLNKPEFLSDALKFGIKLEVLSRAYLNFESGSSLLRPERLQMLGGNIPVFYINTNDETLELLSGEKNNLIERTAIENICYKIRSFCLEDYEYQEALISDSIKL